MRKLNLEVKQQIIAKLLKRKITVKEASNQLGCKRQTIYNYLNKAARGGLAALKDGRHSNNYKLTPKQISEVLRKKEQGSWRSARKALEITNIQSISERRVQQIWAEHGLNHPNLERLKPIVRFVAKEPNDLWQADIMGKVYFPLLRNPHTGELGCWAYLIANLDDHSRFILGGKFFSKQTQMNVFRVWYQCLLRWGLPKAMLQDEGTQYRSQKPFSQTTYQYYAQVLGIDLKWAPRAQTKGKIERFWRFVQQDFVRENLKVRSFYELNQAFFKWQIKYNEEFKHSGIGMYKRTPAQVYQPSERRRPKQELQQLLTLIVRRYVYTDSTISLFGVRYKIPAGYIKCRIWVYIRGDKAWIESMGKIFYKFRLKI